MPKSIRITTPAVLALGAALLGSASTVAAATVEAVAVQDGNARSHFTGLSLGYEFTPTADLTVTHLGTYDRDNNGLAEDHPTGIYRVDDQTLVGSVTVESDAGLSIGTSPQGYFRYAEVEPFTLTAGETYRIVTYVAGNSPDLWLDGTYTGYSDAPEIVVSGGYYAEYVTGLLYPQVFYYTGAPLIGPNFRFDVVPEPATLGLLATAAVFVTRRPRR